MSIDMQAYEQAKKQSVLLSQVRHTTCTCRGKTSILLENEQTIASS